MLTGKQYDDCEDNNQEPPYSQKDYEEAKSMGLDLDEWNDYVRFYHLGEEEEEY